MRDRILALLGSVTHVALPALYDALNPHDLPGVAAEVESALAALVDAGKVKRIGQNVRLS